MIKTSVLSSKDFDALLEWFSSDRETAGAEYEKIRAGLINFFRFRGCSEQEILADETINRVAAKLSSFDFSGNAKKISFFYGFASKIYLEYISQTNRREFQLDAEPQSEPADLTFFEDAGDDDFECLEKCLDKLPSDDKTLVLEYYGSDKSAKFDARKILAEKINLKPKTLYTKVHRIRIVLKKCVENCLQKNNL